MHQASKLQLPLHDMLAAAQQFAVGYGDRILKSIGTLVFAAVLTLASPSHRARVPRKKLLPPMPSNNLSRRRRMDRKRYRSRDALGLLRAIHAELPGHARDNQIEAAQDVVGIIE